MLNNYKIAVTKASIAKKTPVNMKYKTHHISVMI